MTIYIINTSTLKSLTDLVEDGAKCARLSDFEEKFLDDLALRLQQYGPSTRLSEAQWSVIQHIERKVYLT